MLKSLLKVSVKTVVGRLQETTPRNVCTLQFLAYKLSNTRNPTYPAFFLTSRDFSKERASKGVKPGEAVVLEGVPHKVGRITQGKRGKGGGYVRAVLKNLVTGQVFEKTFLTDEVVELAELEREVCQYSWSDGSMFSFLHSTTFEEIQLSKEDIGTDCEFLVEGQEVKVAKFREKIIGVELPKTYEYEVLSIDPQKTRYVVIKYSVYLLCHFSSHCNDFLCLCI
jgi:elongation factor P